MNLIKRISTTGTIVAAVLIGLGSGSAHADDDSLLALLGLPSVTVACFPSGHVGQGNTFTGTQPVNCGQSAQATAPEGGGGSKGRQQYSGDGVTIAPGESGFAVAACPAGKVATGGGYDTFPRGFRAEAERYIQATFESPSSWTVRGLNEGSEPVSLVAYVLR